MTRWISATAKHKGARREQQDRVVNFEDPAHDEYLIVVSDGVGGQEGGALASEAVVRVAKAMWETRNGEMTPADFLATLCRHAHEEINRIGVRESVSPRATIAAVYVARGRADWLHSGDSRIYRFHGEECFARTRDHSVLQILVDQGQVKEEAMGTHPDQGKLLQSLGGEVYKEPSAAFADVGPGEGFLACTDGFWERIHREEAGKVIVSRKLQANLEAAVEEAARRGGEKSDNVAAAALVLPVGGAAGVLPLKYIIPLIAAAAVVIIGLFLAYLKHGSDSQHGADNPKDQVPTQVAVVTDTNVLPVETRPGVKVTAPTPAPTPPPKRATPTPVPIAVNPPPTENPPPTVPPAPDAGTATDPSKPDNLQSDKKLAEEARRAEETKKAEERKFAAQEAALLKQQQEEQRLRQEALRNATKPVAPSPQQLEKERKDLETKVAKERDEAAKKAKIEQDRIKKEQKDQDDLKALQKREAEARTRKAEEDARKAAADAKKAEIEADKAEKDKDKDKKKKEKGGFRGPTPVPNPPAPFVNKA